MWDYNSTDYNKFIKFLYKNLKMSDNFINKIIFGFWQRTEIYKILIKEKEKIMHDLYDYSLKEHKILLLKWNQKYQIKYNEFLEEIKFNMLDDDPNKSEKIKDLIKKNKIIKKQLTDDLDPGLDININNGINNYIKNKEYKRVLDSNKDIDKKVKKNELINNNNKEFNQKIKKDNIQNIKEIYQDKIKNDSIDFTKEDKNSEIKTIDKDSEIKTIDKDLEIKNIDKDSEIKTIDKNQKINLIDKNEYNIKNINLIKHKNMEKLSKSLNISENEINNFRINNLDENLNKSLNQYNKDLNKYNKILESKKKYIENNPVINIDNKLPNFSKEIIKLKKLKIPSFDIIINDNEKIYIYKRKNCIIIKLNEEIKNEVMLSLDGLDKLKKSDDKIIIPIKIVKSKKIN